MLKYRGVVLLYEDVCEKWLEVMLEGGLNVLGLHAIVRKDEKSYHAVMERYLAWYERAETKALIEKFEKSGISVEHELHIMSYLLPREMFDTDPDMFRLENGVRVREGNLCPSSAAGTKIVADNASKLCRELKTQTHRYYLWQDDHSFGKKCHCEKCGALSVQDQAYMLSAAVLDGLKRADSSASIAYLDYEPKAGLPRLVPGADVFLEFAPFERDHESPLKGGGEKNAEYAARFTALSKLFDGKEKHVLEYFLDLSLQTGWDKSKVRRVSFDADRVRRDVSFYVENGADFITTFAAYIDDAYFEKYGCDEIIQYGKILAAFA